MSKIVLLIGRNPAVLVNLASALTGEGLSIKITNRVEQAGQDFSAADFDLIAFGRGVNERTNAMLRETFLAQNPAIRFVDGLAPVIPLLVKQIKLALADRSITEPVITRFSCRQMEELQIQVFTRIGCQLTIDLYQLDAVHTTRQKTLVSESVSAGNHCFSVDIKSSTDATINFLAAEAANLDLAVLPIP